VLAEGGWVVKGPAFPECSGRVRLPRAWYMSMYFGY
jgi:hypothetical protein